MERHEDNVRDLPTPYNEMPRVKFKLLEDDAVMPEYATLGSAGFDFTCINDTEIKPGRTEMIRTGLAVAIPDGFYMAIVPRSSTGIKTPLRMPNSMGIIDSDYRGEIMLIFTNTGRKIFTAQKGRKLAQGIIMPIIRFPLISVDYLGETVRGTHGFGSTGL
jgi:dUTP pyrophosphatase